MDENTLDDLTQKLQSADPNNPQLVNGTPVAPANDGSQDEGSTKPTQSYAFATPSEMGIRETDPDKIPAAPRPQPGMTFTPTGGSVSNIHHQLNRQDPDEDETGPTVITPSQPQ